MRRRHSCPRPRVSPPSPPSWEAAWSITGEGEREGKRGVNQSLGTQRARKLLRVVTSAVLGRFCKNEPFLHLLEVSLLHAL